MRLIVARCSVAYSGRLSAVLPEALRLVMLKADGSVLVHADAGGYKPLNWMTPPTVIEERGRHRSSCASSRARTGSRSARRGALRRRRTHGRGRAALEKDGVERDLQELLAGRAAVVRRGLPARAARVADGHRAGRPHVPRRRRRLGRGRDQARRRRSTRSSSSTRYLERIRLDPGDGGLPRRARGPGRSSRRRACWPRRAGIAWVEVDLAVLRGEREPALTLFARGAELSTQPGPRPSAATASC